MSKKTGTFAVLMRFIFIVLIVMVSSASAQRGQKKVEDMTPEEKQAKMNELLKQREKMNQQKAATGEVSRPTGQTLNDVITRYEKLFEQCAVRKSDRCGDVMFTLGSLYNDQGREKTPPDYSKALKMYWQLSREYPSFNHLSAAFTQMANIYLAIGHLDSAKIVLEQHVQRFPKSPRASSAHLLLGDLAFISEQYDKAYNHYLKVKENEVNPIMWEFTHYALGVCAYYMGNYKAAIRFFNDYIKQYNNGKYKNNEHYNSVLEYMDKAKDNRK